MPCEPVARPPSTTLGEKVNRFLDFFMTPQPNYGPRVGVPMLVLTGIWMVVTLLVTFLVPQEKQGAHLITLGTGLLGLPVVFLFLHLRWAALRGKDDQATPAVRCFLGVPAWLWPWPS